MSTSNTSEAVLQRAYSLIENDELDKAQEILAPLLQDDANNAHLWWVYTHAVQDASIGQAALERVLELDPQYPGARELKADVLEAQSQDPDLIALEASEPSSADAGTAIDVDDWEDLRPAVDADEAGSSSRGRFVLIAFLLIIVVGGGLALSGAVDLSLLLSNILPSPEPRLIVVSEPKSEPTTANLAGEATLAPEAANAVSESNIGPAPPAAADSEIDGSAAETKQAPSADSTEVPTAKATVDASPIPSPTIQTNSADIAGFVSSVAAAIEEFPILPWKSGRLPTELGNTLVIMICAVPGPEFNLRLNIVLTSVVGLATDLPEDIAAVAAGLHNCDDPEGDLRIIGVTREVISAFANEEIKAKEYQRAWQPLS